MTLPSLNYKMIVAYEGGAYLGWQKTRHGPSIEEELEKGLELMLRHPVTLQAASRTDGGVHADGQVVNFRTAVRRYDCGRLLQSLNGLLPADIRVRELTLADDAFHPTLDACGKEYHYLIDNGAVYEPKQRHCYWHVAQPLDLTLMQRAIPLLEGRRDFAAFCNSGNKQDYEDTVRTLQSIDIVLLGDQRLMIKVRGDNFLYNMVRNIVGTLVYVAQQRIALSELPSIVDGRRRSAAGVTAPAHGLTLHRVFYS